MLVLFGILIIIACVVLGFIVLVQEPKGGGLSASLGGFGNQIMGVKRTTDILEKGTWLFGGIVALLCIISTAFIGKGTSGGDGVLDKMPTSLPAQKTAPAPATTTPMPGTQSTPAPATTTP